MKIGEVVKKLDIPAKGIRAGNQKYPFEMLKQGDGFMVLPDVEEGLTLAQMKKRITEAVRQYERRCGKVGGEKAKDFAVWIEEKENGVYVALRKERKGEAVKPPAPKRVVKKVVKKAAPAKKSKKAPKKAGPVSLIP